MSEYPSLMFVSIWKNIFGQNVKEICISNFYAQEWI